MDLHAARQSSASSYRGDAPPRDLRPPHQSGVTLIELMVVLTIVGILGALAVPGFARFVSGQRASSATNDLVHAIALARGEALKRGRRVYLAPVATRWRDGWAVFVDRNDNRLFDPPTVPAGDELITLHERLPDSITISNPSNPAREPFTDVGAPQRAYVMFDGHGYPRQRSGGLGIGSLVVTDRTGNATTIRTICLAAYGRVRVVADRAGCS